MKRAFVKIAVQAGAILLLYSILLRRVGGSSLVAGIFCPGPHLPVHRIVLIGMAWLGTRRAKG